MTYLLHNPVLVPICSWRCGGTKEDAVAATRVEFKFGVMRALQQVPHPTPTLHDEVEDLVVRILVYVLPIVGALPGTPW